ncbi:outer membrane beta-barrel protein [Hymenobacter sp. DH14]|uniref:Outer membrane beta-barrel protein n=1 Tax=Hymenobacter cyanobacteriorum TaxID=2926463 RepID=A0A9X1VLH8_9BACT|nr:outer membrane beta-barrel protein [Hymenobacter cyanobacteriorum]MCI1189230.1 outer membrane beta-barrel protein [Hymenobacter cyanobacteriorum]
MRLPSLALGGLLLAAALPAHAQTAPAAARYYVGLAAYSSYFQPLGDLSQANRNEVRVPLQLVAGYQLRPRLAVQVGVAYSGTTASYATAGRAYSPANPTQGTYFDYNATDTQRRVTLSVLARYTLTRNAAHRVQFDALGGFTLEHGRTFLRGTQADSVGGAFVVSPFSYHASRTNLLLTAGLGTRLRLSPRFTLFYDFTLNKNLNMPGYLPGSLTSSSALGLRYRFGR